MLHIALCDDNPASIEILEKYFDILNDSTIDYDVYFSAEELYRYKLNNELTYDIYILDIEMQGMNGLELANYAQTECQFRYCGTAIPFLTVRSTAR